MKFIRTLLIGFVFSNVAISIVSADPLLEAQQKFSNLENELMLAVKNREADAMSRFLAKDFTLVSSESNGETITRRGYIFGATQSEFLIVESFEFQSIDVTPLGEDSMIVYAQLDWRSTYKGAPWNSLFLITDIWVRNDQDDWRLRWRHSSYRAKDLPRIVEERGREATPK